MSADVTEKPINPILRLVRREVATFSPSYFALVMATGIVSLASLRAGYPALAKGLFYLNIVAYCLLWVVTLWRLISFRKQLSADVMSHSRNPGFLTMVAGTSLLGSQFLLLNADAATATIFLVLAGFLWVILMYSFLTMTTVKPKKPPIEEGLNGLWLLTTVATQSISILGVHLLPFLRVSQEVTLFSSLSLFFVGCVLYLIVITLIFYRLAFFGLKPSRMAPAYWINMGAVAITVLAGSTLLTVTNDYELLFPLRGFIMGLTILFWALATWWIPLILILGVWRHIYSCYPLRYSSQYWGLVFPLGMYTMCTYKMADADSLSFLQIIPKYFVYVALFAWVLAFAGMIGKAVTKLWKTAKSSRFEI